MSVASEAPGLWCSVPAARTKTVPSNTRHHARRPLEFSYVSPFSASHEDTPPPAGTGVDQGHQQLLCDSQGHVGGGATPSTGSSWPRTEDSKDALLRDTRPWETWCSREGCCRPGNSQQPRRLFLSRSPRIGLALWPSGAASLSRPLAQAFPLVKPVHTDSHLSICCSGDSGEDMWGFGLFVFNLFLFSCLRPPACQVRRSSLVSLSEWGGKSQDSPCGLEGPPLETNPEVP